MEWPGICCHEVNYIVIVDMVSLICRSDCRVAAGALPSAWSGIREGVPASRAGPGDEVGVVEGGGGAFGGGDGRAEEVAELADVAAGGVGLVQDAVLADGHHAAGDPGLQLDLPVADRVEGERGALGDEQVLAVLLTVSLEPADSDFAALSFSTSPARLASADGAA
jgi:hypothetical protein